ncbi:hypothetical protein K1T71_010494 [Dendrolimus kikuchii]|uniref:Uncharacterized protein n=1 Tax=Dendrolimus kikuchii TaxID=765133 RepID=A0ACC1CRN2_9NEOP|nr:hypothetical protein K1T71_010494 [Dendrolimus kikuchii]
MAVAINKGVFIVAAKRTPFGKMGGLLKDMHPSDLLAVAAKDAFKAGNVAPDLIDTANIGQVYSISGTSDGGLSPRHAALKSGVPQEKPVLGVNRLCGSGFQAVINSAQDIMTGVAQVSLAGGTENMSAVPFVVRNTRFGVPLGVNLPFEDMLSAGSLDSYCNFTMPQTAENLAEKYQLKRSEVDEFSLESQRRWKVVVGTAGNSSGVNDGAGALIVASEEAVKQHSLTPLVRLRGWSFVGVDPSVMGIGPVPAIQGLLSATGLKLGDIDLIEINEAFASQTLACVKELGIDLSKLNVNGGAIAIGHPVGASGARITAHLAHELRRRGLKRAIGSACIGGGQGIALLLESV